MVSRMAKEGHTTLCSVSEHSQSIQLSKNAGELPSRITAFRANQDRDMHEITLSPGNEARIRHNNQLEIALCETRVILVATRD